MDKKISELPEATSISDSDDFAVARAGASMRATAQTASKFYGISIQTSPLAYVPAATNNPDRNKVVPGSNGFWYLLDKAGAAIKITDLLTGFTVEDANYIHNQGVAAATWTVTHNLGKYPTVRVVDSANSEIGLVEIVHTDANSFIVYNAFSFSGKVFCN